MAADSDRPDRPGLVILTSHWLTRLGLVLGITAVSTWLFVLPAELHGRVENPYKGVILYLILPAVLLAGIAMAAAGVTLSRRRIRTGLQEVRNRSLAWQRLLVFLGLTIGVNLLVGTQLTYRAVAYMDTPQFCGATCHSMKPEFVGHQDSNHASVACAECHIAPGAGGWITAKMNGARQVWETVTGTDPRPIPSALESGRLVPSRETCERCHWAEKIVASRLIVVPKYASDETSSASYTVLMMRVGGRVMAGIHQAHFAGGFEIRYATSDPQRQTIPFVERRNLQTGQSTTYVADGTTPEQAQRLPQYVMQCVDCHGRPTHDFSPPDRALNQALALGAVPATLPFIKREGLRTLEASYQSDEEAAQKIPATIEQFYQQQYPAVYADRRADVTRAAQAILAVYARNVFQGQGVTWKTYPNNLGHTDFPGCFRCHDESHTSAGGPDAIHQDCDSCHRLLAVEEASPEVLKTLGVWDQIVGMKRH